MFTHLASSADGTPAGRSALRSRLLPLCLPVGMLASSKWVWGQRRSAMLIPKRKQYETYLVLEVSFPFFCWGISFSAWRLVLGVSSIDQRCAFQRERITKRTLCWKSPVHSSAGESHSWLGRRFWARQDLFPRFYRWTAVF